MSNKLRMKHISHNDLDGYSCTILSELLAECYPSGMFELETLNISPNRLNREIKNTLEELDNYSMIVITDLSINKETVELITTCNAPDKFKILDHHLIDFEDELPDNFIIHKNCYSEPDKLTCATLLYYSFIQSDSIYDLFSKGINTHNLNHYVHVVRNYDTYDFTNRLEEDELDIEDLDAPRLNTLFHELPLDEFKNYIKAYINGDIEWMMLTVSSNKYPWISKILEISENKNEAYVNNALKRLMITKFVYEIYRDEKIYKFDYNIGVIYAEQNGPTIGNIVCKNNSDIDFCAIVNNNQVLLYTNKDEIDVSLIARVLGGGGHLKASGFTIPYQSSNIYNINHFCEIIKCAGKIS